MRAVLQILVPWPLLAAAVHAGLGETPQEIRERYSKIIFSARPDANGPKHEEYVFMGRRVEVFYRDGVSKIEVFHDVKDVADAQRMLELTQNAGEWKRRMQTEKRAEWESGPLRAAYEPGQLVVTFANAAEDKQEPLKKLAD